MDKTTIKKPFTILEPSFRELLKAFLQVKAEEVEMKPKKQAKK